jgi:hypothetical protein
MKQLARSVPLVVVLLLASVGTASAECAWVLWSKVGSDDWSPHTGFPASELCYSAISAELAQDTARKYVMHDLVTRRHPGEAFYVHAGLQRSIHMKCLPDTIDPRGPKGR